jgi:hypothetical protein
LISLSLGAASAESWMLIPYLRYLQLTKEL